jgi:hypothetical protein
MKTRLLVLLAVFMSAHVFAQPHNCGVPSQSFEVELKQRQLLQQIKKSAIRLHEAGEITYVPVKMHLFGLDDNTGYATPDDVNDMLAELNRSFLPMEMQFYFSGTGFNYYPNTLFYNYNQTDADLTNFHAANAVNNAMNLYVSKDVKVGGNIVGGYSYVAPTAQQYNMTWLNIGQLNDDKSTPHEFGHYFWLGHTFDNSTSPIVANRELVTRNPNEVLPRIAANCANAGDYVCDTEADPRGNGDATVNNCVYSGTVTDANGDLFHPLVSNYMDYNFCRQYTFTPGQYERMREGFLIVTTPSNNFTLNAPETVQPSASNLIASSLTTDYYGNITLSWQDNSSVETGYIIERSTSPGGPFVAVKGVPANTTTTMVPADAGDTYYFRIKPSNAKNIYSNVSNGVALSLLCGNNSGQTCDLAANPDLASWYLQKFTLTQNSQPIISNTSSCSTGGIGNYYHLLSAPILPGNLLNFTAASKTGTNGGYTIVAKIFVDWNKDNAFDALTETVFSSTPAWGQVSGQFSVPSTITPGEFRLRVGISAGGSEGIPTPCNLVFGEFEDYKLVYAQSSSSPLDGGVVTTIAGGGEDGTGSSIPAKTAKLTQPVGIYVSNNGNKYIADGIGHKVYKVDETGILTCIAGTGVAGYSGDNGLATAGQINNPYGIYADAEENIYIGTIGDFRIRKVNKDGIISTVAGTGIKGYSGDGGLASAASVGYTQGITGDAAGNIYFTELAYGVLRKINPAGIITTIAGTGSSGYSGDGGPATSAQLGSPVSVSLDAVGNIYIGDDIPNCVRKINTLGVISTVAGWGTDLNGDGKIDITDVVQGDSGDGGPATSALFKDIECAIADAAGNIYIVDAGSSKIRKVNTAGIINTIAGTGAAGFSGDSVLAGKALFNKPWAISRDQYGDLYVADTRNFLIRKMTVPTTTTGSGNWSEPTLWSKGKLPDAATIVFVNQPVTLNVNAAIWMLDLKTQNLNINPGIKLDVLGH